MVVVVGVIASLPSILHSPPRPDSTHKLYNLLSNASLIQDDIKTGFNCTSLSYGYYTYEANRCVVFHVCLSYIFGEVITLHLSFSCEEGTVFNLERSKCVFHENTPLCSQDSTPRIANKYFGYKDINFL